MTEDDLKSIGLHLFGPRRKIATAIRKWHQANAARSNSSAGSAVRLLSIALFCAY
jgi:hypothetical protein